MRFNDVFDDAQTNANPLRLPAQFGTAAVKPLEDALLFLERNAFALVFDPEAEWGVERGSCCVVREGI